MIALNAPAPGHSYQSQIALLKGDVEGALRLAAKAYQALAPLAATPLINHSGAIAAATMQRVSLTWAMGDGR